MYADMAFVPCIEPADQQEAYAAPAYAFDLSERLRMPVLIRLVTRLSHSRATVDVGDAIEQNQMSLPDDERRFILLPAIARGSYATLVRRQPEFLDESARSPFNAFEDADDTSLGIIACGIGVNYVREAYEDGCPHPLLKIGQYPIPESLLEPILSKCDRILVVEDGYPVVERSLRGFPVRSKPEVLGRLSGDLPRTGELNPQILADALGLGSLPTASPSQTPAGRPPSLCPGCPHADTCNVITSVVREGAGGNGRIFSDAPVSRRGSAFIGGGA